MSIPASQQPPPLRVGVVGVGRVGAVLGAALRGAGHEVIGVTAVSEASLERAGRLLPGVPVLDPDEVVRRADLVLITVPDDRIAEVIDGLASVGALDQPKILVHAAGALGLEPFAPVVARGGLGIALHPAMTFSGTAKDLDRLVGTVVAVTASPEASAVGQSLVLDMGAEPMPLAVQDRAAYHAALVHASNHTVTLVAQAMQILRHRGVDEPGRLLAPIMQATLDNALESGDRALTGPVVRGDAGTVETHRRALREESRDVQEAYLAMARATADRSIARRVVPAELVSPLRAALADEPEDGATSAAE